MTSGAMTGYVSILIPFVEASDPLVWRMDGEGYIYEISPYNKRWAARDLDVG